MKNKQFYQFVIPSVGAMLVTGLYFVVDGIFVGRGVGPAGLAAINIAVPFISIMSAVSLMITMGGATITSIFFARCENARANQTFRLSVFMVLAFTFIMTLISSTFDEELARALGANDALLRDTADYIKYFVMFSVFYCGSNTLSAFVRNDNNPRLALWGMVTGAVSNVILDWIFIFPLQMGIKGAAIASGLGQTLACAVLSTHFLRRRGELQFGIPRFSLKEGWQIAKTGFPEFVTQMSQPVTILCYNLVVMEIFGEIGVSAFSVISYILVVVIGIFTGLAQGVQPLLSRSYGAGNKDEERFFFHKALKVSVILSVGIYGVMYLFGREMIYIFNHDSQLIRLGYACIQIYGICFIFAAINTVYTIYFLATKRTRQAIYLSVMRSFVVNSVFIFLMPMVFGPGAIWTGMIIAEALVLLNAIWISRREAGRQGKASRTDE